MHSNYTTLPCFSCIINLVIVMFHIKEKVITMLEVKKSKFYCVLLPIQDDKMTKEVITDLKKEYPGATHYCYGAIIGDITRSNDDGEPSSTAGKPILETLKNAQLDQVLAVVIRYFGGTLLGTSGLVKAYSQATSLAIEQAVFTTPTTVYNYQIRLPYHLTNKLEFLLKGKAIITDRLYDDEATYLFQCQHDLTDEIRELTSGQYLPQLLSSEVKEIF